jgi:hypothetical protein
MVAFQFEGQPQALHSEKHLALQVLGMEPTSERPFPFGDRILKGCVHRIISDLMINAKKQTSTKYVSQ